MSHRLVLAVDVDGTIWSPYGLAAEEINRLSKGKFSLTLGDMIHYDSFHEIAGRDLATAGFVKACADPVTVMRRKLYPGVPQAIAKLHDMGVRVHFITHNPAPRVMRPALARWLRELIDVPFGLSITETGSKTPLMRRAGAFGIVDDKPGMMEEALSEGFWVATKIQQWNQEILLEKPEIIGFDDWHVVPTLVEKELESTVQRTESVV